MVRAQLVLSSLVIAAVVAVAVLAPWLAPYGPEETDFGRALEPPSWDHPMGTDQEGRDLLSRLIHGSRVSVAVALGTAFMALVVGTVYGGVSGYLGGRADDVMMRVVDTFYSVPDLLLVVLLTLVMGKGVLGIVLSLGITAWMRVARVVRASVLQLKEVPYIDAARSLGAGHVRIFIKHMVPNLLTPLIVTLTFSIPYAILAESTLSFLGLGIAPPAASWGTLASEGWEGLRTYPHLLLFPSAAIFATAFAFNLLGEGLRDLLDPRGVSR